MKRLVFALLLIVISTSSFAQWKKIASFEGVAAGDIPWGQTVHYVYFLDMPGPPRVGFAGCSEALYKTSNGGLNWLQVWGDSDPSDDHQITGICFKDSLTGWFTTYNMYGLEADTLCHRTTDGGITWEPIIMKGIILGCDGISYYPAINTLYIYPVDTGLDPAGLGVFRSTNLGDTWEHSSPCLGDPNFFSDSIGFASIGCDSFPGYSITSDGGRTWSHGSFSADSALATCQGPLAIKGTSICFSVEASQIIVHRSDDYGKTWRIIKDFGPVQDSQFNTIAPYGTGVIRGDLSRLYIQSDSGMFISTDSGYTWLKEKGSPLYTDAAGTHIFYASKGVTIAGSMDPPSSQTLEGQGLWEEIWPQSGVAGSTNGAPEPSSVSIEVSPNPTLGTFSISSSEPILSVHIRSMLGTDVLTIAKINQQNFSIDLSKEPSGTYFVEIVTLKGRVLRKIISQ